MLRELTKTTYNKKGPINQNDTEMSKSIDLLLNDVDVSHRRKNSKTNILQRKKDHTNFASVLDKSDYTSNFKTNSNIRNYYDLLKNISTLDMKSTIDLSQPQSRTTKSAEKYKKIISKQNTTRSSSEIGIRKRNDFNQNKKSSDEKEILEKYSASDNLTTLENMIAQIKLNGFEKHKHLINEKLKSKMKLELEVEKLQKQINYINFQKKDLESIYTRIGNEINQNYLLVDRWRREVFFMNKEVDECQKEIPEQKEDLRNKINETKMIKLLIDEENRQTEMLKEDIRKLNKKISNVEKEKDNYRNGIFLLKKHIEVLKDKIRIEDERSKEFLQNVSMLLDRNVKNKYK